MYCLPYQSIKWERGSFCKEICIEMPSWKTSLPASAFSKIKSCAQGFILLSKLLFPYLLQSFKLSHHVGTWDWSLTTQWDIRCLRTKTRQEPAKQSQLLQEENHLHFQNTLDCVWSYSWDLRPILALGFSVWCLNFMKFALVSCLVDMCSFMVK